jgi:hypothetical protein
MAGFNPFKNFFLNSTKKNNRKLARIGKYMFDAMTANAGISFIATCLAELTTPHDTWIGLTATKAASAGPQHGAVVGKNAVMASIHGTYLKLWDRQIQNFYDNTTPEYAAIFPNGHSKLHEGTVDDQLIELAAIIENMGAYSSLNTIAAAMTTVYDSAFGKQTTVATTKTGKRTAGANVATGRAAYGGTLFGLFGALVHEYWDDATTLALYIDWQTIQRKAKDNIFDKIALMHTVAQIAIRTYLADDDITIINLGAGDLKFYVIRAPGEPCGIFVTVPAGQTLTFARSLFGNMTWRYFMVENDSMTLDVHYILTFPN